MILCSKANLITGFLLLTMLYFMMICKWHRKNLEMDYLYMMLLAITDLITFPTCMDTFSNIPDFHDPHYGYVYLILFFILSNRGRETLYCGMPDYLYHLAQTLHKSRSQRVISPFSPLLNYWRFHLRVAVEVNRWRPTTIAIHCTWPSWFVSGNPQLIWRVHINKSIRYNVSGNDLCLCFLLITMF